MVHRRTILRIFVVMNGSIMNEYLGAKLDARINGWDFIACDLCMYLERVEWFRYEHVLN